MNHPRDLWNFNDPAASETVFRDLLATAVEAEDQFVLKTQIARALGLQRKFDEGQALLDELPQVHGVSTRWETCALLERGRLLRSSGKPSEAKPFFDRAATTPFDDLRIDAIHMQAIIAESNDALALNEKAIAEAQASQDPYARLWLGSLLNNTAWTHHDLGNYERALELFRDALAFRQEKGDAESVRVARWSVGRCLRSLGRLREALGVQEDLALGSEDGYVSEELAECLLALGRCDEAAPHFANAHRLLSQDSWFAENESERLARLGNLGAGS